jgi:hypothetical protein
MFDNTQQSQRQSKGKLLPLLSFVVTLVICSSAYSQSVVIFEDPNFGGRSKTLGIGDHKLTDFNEVVSSIRVPDGLVSFVPHNDSFKVSFERVGIKPGTTDIVQGFLVIETTVGTVTQIPTQAKFPGAANPISFPMGTDPNKVHQVLERQLFKKVAGHYLFSVLQTEMGN